MYPGKLDLVIRQGDTFNQVFTLSNPGSTPVTPGSRVDLTGCAAEMQLRTEAGSSIAAYSLSSAAPNATGGTITMGGTAGTITVSIPASDTDALGSAARRVFYVYDLRIMFSTGTINTLIAGSVQVIPGVTQWS